MSRARGSRDGRGSRRSRARRAGFTLIELMLAVTMLSIVIYMTLDSLTRQQKTSITTEQIVEVQQNVRALASLLEREIRMAGFMVPNAVSVCGVDATTGPDQLFVSETEMIVPDDERAGDLGARVSNWDQAWTASAANHALTVDSTDLDDDGVYFYDNDGDLTPESDFRVGAGWILADMNNPQRGTVCGTVTAAGNSNVTVQIAAGQLDLLVVSDAEEEIVIVPAAHYAINAAATTGRLERNGDLLAHGIDDFQVSYFYDMDDDGVIDSAAAENPGVNTTTFDPSDWPNDLLKEVRFSVVVRTRANDPNYDQGSFLRFENRVAPLPAVNDGFRRRVIVASVRPRNVGNSGSI